MYRYLHHFHTIQHSSIPNLEFPESLLLTQLQFWQPWRWKNEFHIHKNGTFSAFYVRLFSHSLYLSWGRKCHPILEEGGVGSHYSAILHLKIPIDSRGSQAAKQGKKNPTIFRRMQQKNGRKVKSSEHRNQNLSGIARDPREQFSFSSPGGLWHLTWLLARWWRQQVRVPKVRLGQASLLFKS